MSCYKSKWNKGFNTSGWLNSLRDPEWDKQDKLKLWIIFVFAFDSITAKWPTA